MAIDTIQYATVTVSDQDAAIRFYTEALGLELRGDWPFDGGQRFVTVGPAGGQGAGIVLEVAGEREPGGFTGIVLGSGDVEGTHGELAARGVVFPLPPARQSWGAVMGLLADPDGNVLALHEA